MKKTFFLGGGICKGYFVTGEHFIQNLKKEMTLKYKLFIGILLVFIARQIILDWENFKAGLLGSPEVVEMKMPNLEKIEENNKIDKIKINMNSLKFKNYNQYEKSIL